MYLKIYCDRHYSYFDDVCKGLYEMGYPVHVDFLGGYKPEDRDGLYDFLSRELSGDFVQMSFCSPDKFNKNFNAKHSIGFLSNSAVGWNDNFEKMDKIFVMNSKSKRKLDKYSLNSELINPYFEEIKIKKKKTGTHSFFTNCRWHDSRWKDLVIAYCRQFNKDDNTSLIIMSDENYDVVNKDINVHLKVNGFNRMNSPQICVFDKRLFSEAISCADVYISINNAESFDRNVIDCMASGVPVAVFEKDMYMDFCKNNSSYLISNLKSMEDFFAMNYDRKNISESKSKFAKEFVTNNYCKKNFFNKIVKEIESVGVVSEGEVSLPSTEIFNSIYEVVSI